MPASPASKPAAPSARNIAVAVAGAGGRMGRTLIQALAEAPELRLSGALEGADSTHLGMDSGALAGLAANGVAVEQDAAACAAACEVLIDFSTPAASVAHAAACRAAGTPMVIGTTGLDGQQHAALGAAAEEIPIVQAPNMSVGVNLCLRLLEVAAQVLGADADVEISEIHHRDKVDAPSGTALEMGAVIAAVLGRDLAECAVYGRQGQTGRRSRNTIGFATLRGGDVVGEHHAIFAGPGERVEISHRAGNRMCFAQGALRAARWVAGRKAGLYNMRDVLGLG